MNIRTLWYLLSALSCGGVSAGARRLGIAQATMSGALRELESDIGSRLFDQTPIGLRPTLAAIRLRDYALSLILEVEQAILDANAAQALQAVPMSVSLYGIPRCSVVDWATMRAVFGSAAQGELHCSIVAADSPVPPSEAPEGIVIQYGLIETGRRLSGPRTQVPDTWSLLAIRGALPVAGPIHWQDLSRLRLLMPALGEDLVNLVGSDSPGLQIEAITFDTAGVPYTLLDQKDAAILAPTSCLPERFVTAGLQAVRVHSSRFRPAVRIDVLGGASPSVPLVQEIMAQLKTSLAGATPAPTLNCVEAKIDLHTLKCFHATVETGTTAKAAAECFVVQPALSRQIKKLEAALGQRLFVRSPSGMIPTRTGQRFHSYIEPVLNDHVAVRERIRDPQWSGERGGRIRLGIVPAANEDSLVARAAAAAIRQWRSQFRSYPVSVAEGYTSVLLRWLRTHLIDLALIDTTDDQPGLRIIPILTEPIALVFAPQSRWAGSTTPLNGEMLDASRLVMPSRRFGLRALFDKAFDASIQPGLEVDSLAIALQLVRSGEWATILPPSAVHQQLQDGKLRWRQLSNPSIERRLCVALRARSTLQVEAADLLVKLVHAFAISEDVVGGIGVLKTWENALAEIESLTVATGKTRRPQ